MRVEMFKKKKRTLTMEEKHLKKNTSVIVYINI